MKIYDVNINEWAEAISERVSDEWCGRDCFPEDAKLLRNVLSNSLKLNPVGCAKLIGTGIIEIDYFSDLQ